MNSVFFSIGVAAAISPLMAQPHPATIAVEMRDGVKLATDVYLPVGAGKFPVLVSRSPYAKSGERTSAEFFALNGYVFVAQDVRGRAASEGLTQRN
jgi:uncharacterized protein